MSNEDGKTKVELYDSTGAPLKGAIPKRLSASWCQKAYYKGQARVGTFDKDGQSGDPVREALVRAQVPYVVTLLIYRSKFEISPTMREYFVYAPQEPQKAAELAMRLWQRWEKPRKKVGEFNFEDIRDTYPKVGEGVVAEPIDDSDFQAHWRDVKARSHKMAGLPDDPFAFTCLDPDVRVFKTSDVQEGLNVTIS